MKFTQAAIIRAENGEGKYTLNCFSEWESLWQTPCKSVFAGHNRHICSVTT